MRINYNIRAILVEATRTSARNQLGILVELHEGHEGSMHTHSMYLVHTVCHLRLVFWRHRRGIVVRAHVSEYPELVKQACKPFPHVTEIRKLVNVPVQCSSSALLVEEESHLMGVVSDPLEST